MSVRSEAGHHGSVMSPYIHVLNPRDNQDMAEFGDRVFKEVTKVTCCH